MHTWFTALTSAPDFINNLTTSILLFEAALCSGVAPYYHS